MRSYIVRAVTAAAIIGTLWPAGLAQGQVYFGEYAPGSPDNSRSYGGSGRFYSRPAYGGYGGMPLFSRPMYAISGPATVQSPPDENRVRFNFAVPRDAEVWFDDTRTAQTGAVRRFISPPLQPGADYKYRIRVWWMDNGHAFANTRTVTVRPGELVNLTFPEASHANAR